MNTGLIKIVWIFYQIVYDFVIFCQNSHVYFFLMKLTLRGEFKSNYMYRGKKKYLLSRGMEVWSKCCTLTFDVIPSCSSQCGASASVPRVPDPQTWGERGTVGWTSVSAPSLQRSIPCWTSHTRPLSSCQSYAWLPAKRFAESVKFKLGLQEDEKNAQMLESWKDRTLDHPIHWNIQ